MKTEKSSSKERLAFFRDLYENAKNCYAPSLDAFERQMEQYKGSDELDGSTVRAGTVRNITYEIIESQVSSEIPQPKVDAACYSERRERNATSIERLLYSVRDKLAYEEMNDIDERYTYIYGGSVWYAEWDNSIKIGKEVGGVRLYCLPPRNFIPQPNVCSIDDMEYCFLRFSTTKSELARRYGISGESLSLVESDPECAGVCDEGETVPVIVAFYKDESGEIGKYIFSGDLTLLDLPNAYRRKITVCRTCGESEASCRCEKKRLQTKDEIYERLTSRIVRSDGGVISESIPALACGDAAGGFVMKPTEIPYYIPRSFPIVIRKNTSADSQLYGQSDCDYIRPEQQAINKIESRILQKLLRSAVTPIVPEDATISVNNSVFGQVIRIKPGESIAQYGKVDTTPDVSQDIAEAERLYDHSKRILGISDALQGLDTSSSESGYSRQLKISQATGRLESKRKMKHTAYADIDRIIFELYLAFADEPRALVYRDAYGRMHNAEFNRYDFIEFDAENGEYYYDDGYLFSVDLNGGAEYQREALWERNLENLKAGTLGDPTSSITLLRYWQCQERAHYPHARENVEYFALALKEENVTGGVMYGEEA